MSRPRVLTVAILVAASTSMSSYAQPPMPSGARLFEPIAAVLQHPRCMNCHPVTDFPRQTDAAIRHAQLVVRGADGHGATALQCAACHQTSNSAEGKVPGAPHWHLAPLSMAWEGLTKGEICESIKDPAKNGNRRTLHDVIEHMKVDPLVTWAWTPGAGRTTPLISHEEFVRALEAWVAAGGPCPKDDGARSSAR